MVNLYKPKRHKAKKVFGKKSAAKKGYDDVWRKYRFRFLHYNPSCAACGSKERLHVDHIVPHKGDEELFRKLDNHMTLCHKCHSYVTMMFDKFDNPKTEEKMKWIAEQRAKHNITTPIKVLAQYEK